MPKDEIAPGRIFIGLGSNIEPKLEYLERAVRELKQVGEIIAVSSVYETAPVGDVPQPDYLNAVAEVQTKLGPIELVNELKAIERKLGREERPRWHEREIDLDLLFYDDLILESAELTVPHPEAHRRGFVLIPMAELHAEFLHPVWNKTVQELLKPLDLTGIRKTDLSLKP